MCTEKNPNKPEWWVGLEARGRWKPRWRRWHCWLPLTLWPSLRRCWCSVNSGPYRFLGTGTRKRWAVTRSSRSEGLCLCCCSAFCQLRSSRGTRSTWASLLWDRWLRPRLIWKENHIIAKNSNELFSKWIKAFILDGLVKTRGGWLGRKFRCFKRYISSSQTRKVFFKTE